MAIEIAETQALKERIQELETQNETMRAIVLKVAEGRTSWDEKTLIESCRFCSLKRGGEYGYSGSHDETCIVTQARKLGF